MRRNEQGLRVGKASVYCYDCAEMNVKEILDRTPPVILYHYTNQRGLLGILSSKQIWASHTQYLNDAREFQHAIDLMKEELSRMKAEAAYRDQGHLIAELEEALTLKGIGKMNVCVCSFSQNGDLLSQWRAYGDGPGFSIGFSGDFLRAIANEHSFWLAPVLYQDREQHEFIRTLLNDVLTENLQRGMIQNGDDDARRVGGNLLAYLNRYAPIVKHKSFSEEQEWRIITRPMYCSHKQFGYREGASMLVPYFRIGSLRAAEAHDQRNCGRTNPPSRAILRFASRAACQRRNGRSNRS
jgi:Protein of unknown function (DUF2971)